MASPMRLANRLAAMAFGGPSPTPAQMPAQDTALHLSVAVGGPVATGSASEADVLVTVTPPVGRNRVPSDFCCVIDISGSMGAEAVIQSAAGGTESNGLTMLDIAKHGVKTVVKTLTAADRLSVVWFNHQAAAILPLTVMDEAGQAKAVGVVEGLVEGGGTNIWEGLHAGMEALREGLEELRVGPRAGHRLGHLMLLTDGQTQGRNETIPNLEAYRNKWERLPGTISTFGFGYNIDSQLLCMLAAAGEGTYSFIPDAGFVGTVFINTMSNLLVTMAGEAFLDLEPEEGAEILAVRGGLASRSTGGAGLRVALGTLQYGQSRDVVLRVRVPPAASGDAFLVGKVQYEVTAGEKAESDAVEASAASVALDAGKVEPQVHRASFVEAIAGGMESAARGAEGLAAAGAELRRLAEAVAASSSAGQELVQALLEDISGQGAMAFSEQHYARWGQHYLPSIMFAHKLQQCNNFKDPGVQLYGGELFKSIQDQADELFNTLPAPVRRSRGSPLSGSRAPAAPVSMAAYNDRYGGCVDARSLVQLASGAPCRIGDLSKGDRVLAFGGAIAEVVCVVRTTMATGFASLVRLPGGALVTPHHPVHVDGAWRFPADLAEPEDRACGAVCSVVLRGAPALLVGGVPVVALGHGLQEGAARHAFFGSTRVLDDLRGAPGYEQGQVELHPRHVVREPETGLVSAFDFRL